MLDHSDVVGYREARISHVNLEHSDTNMGKPVALVVGGSRGIGRQIAIDLAELVSVDDFLCFTNYDSNGYRVVVAAKSTSDASKVEPFPPDPNSNESTVSTVAREIQEAGGEAHAVSVDVRYPESITSMLEETAKTYGGLDVLVYNSGAIWWASVEGTPLKRFQLMQRVNPEGKDASTNHKRNNAELKLQVCIPRYRQRCHTLNVMLGKDGWL